MKESTNPLLTQSKQILTLLFCLHFRITFEKNNIQRKRYLMHNRIDCAIKNFTVDGHILHSPSIILQHCLRRYLCIFRSQKKKNDNVSLS